VREPFHYTFFDGLFVISLVEGVHDDKHVIHTDSDQKKRHQSVDSCNLVALSQCDCIPTSETEGDANQPNEGCATAHVNRAAAAQEQDTVAHDEAAGSDDQIEITVDVDQECRQDSIDREKNHFELLRLRRELDDSVLKLLLPSVYKGFTKVWGSVSIHEIEEESGFSAHHVILSGEHVLLYFFWLCSSQEAVHEDASEGVDQRIALSSLNLLEQILIVVIATQVVGVVVTFVDEVKRLLGRETLRKSKS